MKKILSKIMMMAAVMGSITLFGSCKELATVDNAVLNDVKITGNGVSGNAAKVELGSTLQLKLSGKLFNENFQAVWESADESIAKVDANGVVTPVVIGTTKITGYTKNEDVSLGDYVMVTVIGKSLNIKQDAISQAEAD